MPETANRRLNAVAASCELSTSGADQVTVRLLPEPCVTDGALGGFAIWGDGVGVGCGVAVVEDAGLRACIVALGRFGTMGVGR